MERRTRIRVALTVPDPRAIAVLVSARTAGYSESTLRALARWLEGAAVGHDAGEALGAAMERSELHARPVVDLDLQCRFLLELQCRWCGRTASRSCSRR